jgi:hypothetical protein
MGPILVIGTFTSLAMFAALWVLLRESLAGGQNSGRLKQISVCSEAPLESRLTPDDFNFLLGHPTVGRTFLRQLRRERRKVLRLYIRRLRIDFNRVCAELKTLMVQSRQDRPDLARVLVKKRLYFTVRVVQAELGMFCEAAGLTTVDFDQVVDAPESILSDVDRLFLELRTDLS